MALYQKVVKLLDVMPELKYCVVHRLEELHATMAAPSAQGPSIENAGIDDDWIEAGVLGPVTFCLVHTT